MYAGPRFVLNLVRVFDGSFGGATLYENPNYVSPNEVSLTFGNGFAFMAKKKNVVLGFEFFYHRKIQHHNPYVYKLCASLM